MFSIEEYRAVREGAGVIDRTERGSIGVTGNDRAAFLHALLTNDIAALKPGAGCYAAYLTPQGRMIADMVVLELGDMILLDVHPAVKDALLKKLDQLVFSEDVSLKDLTDTLVQFAVSGPASHDIIAKVLDDGPTAEELAARAEYQNSRASFKGEPVIVARVDDVGEPGFTLFIARRSAEDLRRALLAAGARAVGAETAEVLRIEAGRPAFRIDMDEETIPLEAGIEDRAISFTKGCYVGQEVIIRVLHRGHGRVARKLVGLEFEGQDEPSPGARLVAGDRVVGELTSVARSLALGKPIALGYVHRDFVAPGTEVHAIHGETRLPARVAPLPFVLPSSSPW